jgi:hypothetical protein
MNRLLLAVLISISPAIADAASLLAEGSAAYATQITSTIPFEESIVGTSAAGFTLRLASDDGSILATLFDDLHLEAGDVGQTFSAGAGDSGFAGFVAALTDGTPHRFLREFWLGGYGAGAGGGGTVTDLEWDAFDLRSPPVAGPDLAGLDIERVEFRLDGFAIEWNSATSVSMSFSSVYSVYGQPVPEASTALMVVSGLIALGALRRTRGRGTR